MGVTPDVTPDTPAVGALLGWKGGEGSTSTSKQEPSGLGQSAADNALLTPMETDMSLSVGAAQSGRVMPSCSCIPTTLSSEHQPNSSESLATYREGEKQVMC